MKVTRQHSLADFDCAKCEEGVGLGTLFYNLLSTASQKMARPLFIVPFLIVSTLNVAGVAERLYYKAKDGPPSNFLKQEDDKHLETAAKKILKEISLMEKRFNSKPPAGPQDGLSFFERLHFNDAAQAEKFYRKRLLEVSYSHLRDALLEDSLGRKLKDHQITERIAALKGIGLDTTQVLACLDALAKANGINPGVFRGRTELRTVMTNLGATSDENALTFPGKGGQVVIGAIKFTP